MKQDGTNQALRYVFCFAAAMFFHAAMFGRLALFPARDALIMAEKGDAWVELEFTRPVHVAAPEEPPLPPKKPPTERMPEPEPPQLDDFEPPEMPEPDPNALLPPPVREARLAPSVALDDLPEPLEESEPEGPQPPGEEEAPAFSPEQTGVREARILGTSKPKYPPACERGLHRPDGRPCEGTAVFLIEVFRDGRIGEVQMVSSAGCRHLDEAVRVWLRNEARAAPARDELGRPVRSMQTCSVKFVVPRDGLP